jgi:hypothetical protein
MRNVYSSVGRRGNWSEDGVTSPCGSGRDRATVDRGRDKVTHVERVA